MPQICPVQGIRTVMDEDFRAVKAFPEKVPCFERVLDFTRAANQIGSIARLYEDLYQPARMPERIEVDGGERNRTEFLHEILPTAENLPGDGFSARHDAVRL